MTFVQLFDRYGPWAALLILFVLMLIPLVKDQIIPALIADLGARRDLQRQIELTRLESAQKTERNIQALATAMAETNTRIAQIMQNQVTIQEREQDILQTLNEGMAAMRENVARREGWERGKREHKAGDTGPLEGKA